MRRVVVDGAAPALHAHAAHGLLALALGDGSVEVHSLRAMVTGSSACLLRLSDHGDDVTALAFGNVMEDDSVTLCTAARDGVLLTTLRIVTYDDGVSVNLAQRVVAGDAIELIGGVDREVHGIAFSADDDTLVACVGDEARVIDIATGDVLSLLRGHCGAVVACGFVTDPGGRRLVVTAGGAEDRAIKLWDLDECAVVYESAVGAAAAVSLDVDSLRPRFAVGTADGCVRTFIVAERDEERVDGAAAAVAPSPPRASPPRPPRASGVAVRELRSVHVGAALATARLAHELGGASGVTAGAATRSPRVIDARRGGGESASSSSSAADVRPSAVQRAAALAQAKAYARIAARRDETASHSSPAVLHVAYQYLSTVALKRGRMNIVEKFDSWSGGGETASRATRRADAEGLGAAQRAQWLVAATARGIVVIDADSFDVAVVEPSPLPSPPSCFASLPTTDRFCDLLRSRAVDGAVPRNHADTYTALRRPLLFVGDAFVAGGILVESAAAHLDRIAGSAAAGAAAPLYAGVGGALGTPSISFTPSRMDRPAGAALYSARVVRPKALKLKKSTTVHGKTRSSGYAAGANVPWSVRQARLKKEKATAKARKLQAKHDARHGGAKVQRAARYPVNCGILSEHQPQHVLPHVGEHVHHTAVTALRYAPSGGRLAAGSVDGAVRVLRLPLSRFGASPAAHMLLGGHDAAISAARWSSDGAFLLTSSQDRSAMLWSIARPQEGPSIVFDRTLHSPVLDAMGNEIPMRRAAGGSAAAYARAAALGRGGGGASLSGRNVKLGAAVVGARFVGQDRLVMLACGPRIKLMSFDANLPKDASGKKKKNTSASASYAHVPKGTLVDVSAMRRDGGMGTYRCEASISLAPARAILALDAINAFVSHVAVASTTDRAVHVLDIAHERSVHTIPDAHSMSRVAHSVVVPRCGEWTTHTAAAIDVFATLSAGGAIGDDSSSGEAKIWDLRTCRCVRMLSEHLNVRKQLGAEFSPCMRYVYVASEDNVVVCYDLRQGAALERIGGRRSVRPIVELASLALSPRHPQIALGALNGVVRFFTQPGLNSTEAARLLERANEARDSAFR